MAQGRLLALIVELLTLFAEQPPACSLTNVLFLDVVPCVAIRVVVMNFLVALFDRVPRRLFRHVFHLPSLWRFAIAVDLHGRVNGCAESTTRGLVNQGLP